MDRRRFLALAAGLAVAGCSPASAAELSDIFAGTEITLVVLNGDETIRWNSQRAGQRFIPASTFKMLNALIALETGAVSGPGETFRWNGEKQPFPTWEQDLTLAEAMRVSALPVYQEVARRVGLARMAEHVTRAGFGNGRIGNLVDRFWLDGSLLVSAEEEARFALRLATGTLPFRPDVQAQVRAMLRQPEDDLYGKTGWSAATTPNIGWFTGWVERHGRIAAFSLNMDMAGTQDAPRRKELAVGALRRLEILARNS